MAAFVVSSVGDAGPGTLRQAITDANAAGGGTIDFAIPGAGVHTIQPFSNLPAITSPTLIDGYSQPGSKPNDRADGDNATLLIELDGSDDADLLNRFQSDAIGLYLAADGAGVQGLAINRFGYWGVLLDGLKPGPAHATVRGNFIGTDPTGTTALRNGIGIEDRNGDGDRIGGGTPADRNVISGNFGDGVEVSSLYVSTPSPHLADGSTDSFGGSFPPMAGHVTVAGNFIGTDATGLKKLGNGGDGVRLLGATASTIGGPTQDLISLMGSGNLISGNGRNGVELGGTGQTIIQASGASSTKAVESVDNVILGNSIGLTSRQVGGLGNADYGILLGPGSAGNRVGGPGDLNDITDNGGMAVADRSGQPNVINAPSAGGNGQRIVELDVTASASTRSARPGEAVLFTYTILNNSERVATGVTFGIFLGPGLAGTRVDASQGTGSVDAGAARIVASLGNLAPGATATVVVTATVQTFAVGPSTYQTGSKAGVAFANEPQYFLDAGGATTSLLVVAGPVVQSINLSAAFGPARTVTLAFSTPLDPSTAADIRNYQILLPGRAGRGLVVDGATFDPAADAVSLHLSRPLPASTRPVALSIGGPGTPGLLDGGGRSAIAGGAAFVATAGFGASQQFLDATGNLASLRLAGGGTLELARGLDGAVASLRILGARAGRSGLSGSVRGAAGLTRLPALHGLAGVRITLTNPPFDGPAGLFAPQSTTAERR